MSKGSELAQRLCEAQSDMTLRCEGHYHLNPDNSLDLNSAFNAVRDAIDYSVRSCVDCGCEDRSVCPDCLWQMPGRDHWVPKEES